MLFKKIFLVSILISTYFISNGQFINTQTTGSNTSIVKSKGAQSADSAFIITNTGDTAYGRQINYYDGTGGKGFGLLGYNGFLYYRYNGAWVKIASSGIIPAQFNPSAGWGVVLSGTYPNITFTVDSVVVASKNELQKKVDSLGVVKLNTGDYGIRYNRGEFDSTLFIPTICGTPSGKASLKDVITNKSAILFDSCGKTFWVYSPTDSAWKNAGGVDTFTTNITVNGTSFGKYPSGSTPNWKGLTAIQAIQDAIVQVIHPTYTAPTASISSSPVFGYYEIGTNLGTVTLSSGYTQNDGGAASTVTYYQNGVSLGAANTTPITSLTTTQSFYVNTAYAQGACKLNNLGVTDCIGQIPAGSVNSGISGYTPFFKRYWGWSNSTAPTNGAILALTQDTNGSTGGITLSNMTPSGSQYLVYFTKGTVSNATVNGIPATAAFTFTTYSVTNAQGYVSTYTYVYSNNAQTSTLSSVIFN